MNSTPNFPHDTHIASSAMPIAGKNDKGKKVRINSVGGALVNWPGTVVYGPYAFNYSMQSSVDVNGKKYKEGKLHMTKFTSSPYWCVKLDGYDRCLSFVQQEMKPA